MFNQLAGRSLEYGVLTIVVAVALTLGVTAVGKSLTGLTNEINHKITAPAPVQ
jgi:Flp pilus assembly pilin Flp